MKTPPANPRRRPLPADQWQAIVSKWRTSGQPARVFAAENNLSLSSLKKWAAAPAGRSQDGGAPEPKRRRSKDPGATSMQGAAPAFVPVRVISKTSPSPLRQDCAIEIELRNGRRVRIVGDVCPTKLAVVLNAADGEIAC